MKEGFDLQAYITGGVERIVSEVIRATLKDPRESVFMVKFAAASKAASKKRAEAEKNGEHIPAFLIASITSQCNLHCAGCYSRSNHATEDGTPVAQLTAEEWRKIFDEAEELGISFIFLLGGEPLLRRDVIEMASRKPHILFPVFTNGTYLDGQYSELFDRCRNLVPVMSIEGDEAVTDARRGEGVYGKLMANMESLREKGLLFGASVTVTTQNLREVTDRTYIEKLAENGCKAMFFIEYVPIDGTSRSLAPGDEERIYLNETISALRENYPEMVFISFPGDEKSSGGCMSAGRAFFHINSHGGAEPCPASPYSDVNVRDRSLREALQSPLFSALRSSGILMDDHAGGCVLYEKKHLVEALTLMK